MLYILHFIVKRAGINWELNITVKIVYNSNKNKQLDPGIHVK